MKIETLTGTAAALRYEREQTALKLRGIAAVMLAQTGETWPCRGAAHTASVRSRALSSVSTRALRTARMTAKRDYLGADEIHIETVGSHRSGR